MDITTNAIQKIETLIRRSKLLKAAVSQTKHLVEAAIELYNLAKRPHTDYAVIETHLRVLTDEIDRFEASLSIHSPKAFSLYCRAVREKPNSTEVRDANRALTILAETPDADQMQEALNLISKVTMSLDEVASRR